MGRPRLVSNMDIGHNHDHAHDAVVCGYSAGTAGLLLGCQGIYTPSSPPTWGTTTPESLIRALEETLVHPFFLIRNISIA